MRRAAMYAVVGIPILAIVCLAWHYEGDPVRRGLDRVQLGMTHDEAEIAMDRAPTVLTDWKERGVDVLNFRGRDGVAEVHVDQATNRVVFKGWAQGREPEWRRLWVWLTTW